MMEATAKVFMSGNSQAIRLPKAFRLDVDKVGIKKEKSGLHIYPLRKKTAGSFKELMDGMGIPPPEKGVDYYQEVFGMKRILEPARPVEL